MINKNKIFNEYYLAPGGREYTLTAGKLAKLDENSRVLDMACGRGIASINIASNFKAKAVAVDINRDFIQDGQKIARKMGVEDKVEFINDNIFDLKFKPGEFDLIMAEGNALSYLGRREGLQLAYKWLKPGGYFEVTDMIINEDIRMPSGLQKLYSGLGWNFETESSYRGLMKNSGFDIIFSSYITRKYLLKYKENIQKELQKKEGAFENDDLRSLLSEELELFYNDKWINYFSYFFIVSQKRGD